MESQAPSPECAVAAQEALPPLVRTVRTATWALVLMTILLIPLRIMGYGFLPTDDALRHTAKAVSGKPWSEILVMRPDLTIDHNPGWHAILGRIHGLTGMDTDGLVSFSVIALFVLFLCSALPWIRRPEAWILALLLLAFTGQNPIGRLLFGRPFILSMAVLVVLLSLWSAGERKGDWRWRVPVSAALIATAVWIHGSWYLFVVPVAAFVAARRLREAAGLGASWLAGSLAGATLTGKPIEFLVGHLRIVTSAFGRNDLQRMLVAEFQPTDGLILVVTIVALMLLLLRINEPNVLARVLRDPVFLCAMLGWLLGLQVGRFWHDWGMPALSLWLARELARVTESGCRSNPLRRLALGAFACASFFLVTTSDYGGRWTYNLTATYLTREDAETAEWLPEKGGIIYSDDMKVFYRTFFKNPHGDWRYILGYEATLMPPEDLEVYRKIQWNFGDAKAFAPWVKKMRPEDRLVLIRPRSGKPDIPELEWEYVVTQTWVGRLPRESGGPGATNPPPPAIRAPQ